MRSRGPLPRETSAFPQKHKAAPSRTRPWESIALGGAGEGLDYPRADFAALAVQGDATAFQQIGDGSHGFVVIPADAAHSEDEFPEAWAVAVIFFEGFFHGVGSFFRGSISC